ncbi:hypothetical protein FSARC_13165 [Fusarium sarcochroum]|uniref:Mitochondrial division protein 1 n=1 Tax=Fusarium sarcochroum TaxID=1208366 RepID=A0A8H4WUQ4_9HYPO|nr:hypothetical protein FSARC_13165 [Fusarium sarcochroum]
MWTCSNDDSLRFISDARRFIGYFQPGIEDTPLQLYSSGIIFSPMVSVVPPPLESRSLPDNIKRYSNVKSYWPQRLHSINFAEECVLGIVFLPNGRLVVVIGWGNIRIWDLDTGKCIHKFALPSCDIHDLAFSDDGRFICSTALRQEHRIGQIHSLSFKQRVNKFAISGNVRNSSLARKGHWIATCTGDLIVLSKWTVTGDLQWTNLENSEGGSNMVFSADGMLLALTAKILISELEWVVKIWRTKTKEQVYKVQLPALIARPRSLALTEQLLAFSVDGGQSMVIDLKTEKVSHRLASWDDGSIAMSNDSRLLTTLPIEDIRTWDLTSIYAPEPADIHPHVVMALQLVSDEKTVLSYSFKEIKIWDVSDGNCKGTLRLDKRKKLSAFTVARKAPIFAMKQDDEINICCFVPFISIRTFETEGSSYIDDELAISTNGERIALVSRSGSTADDSTGRSSLIIEVKDVQSTQLVQTFRATAIRGSSIVFSPDGATIAYVASSTINAFDMLGNELFSVPFEDGFLLNSYPHLVQGPLSFNSGRIVARSEKGCVRTYDARTGERGGYWNIGELAPSFVSDDSFIRPELTRDSADSTNLEVKHPWKAYDFSPDGKTMLIVEYLARHASRQPPVRRSRSAAGVPVDVDAR